MDNRVARLTSPEQCEQFMLNVATTHPELLPEARRRAVELRAEANVARFGATNTAEKDALQAIYAYEEVLFKQRGRRVRASRTWQMVERWGILGAVERAVNRPADSTGYQVLAEMNMQDITFEAVVLRHPNHFNSDVVQRCAERLSDWEQQTAVGVPKPVS